MFTKFLISVAVVLSSIGVVQAAEYKINECKTVIINEPKIDVVGVGRSVQLKIDLGIEEKTYYTTPACLNEIFDRSIEEIEIKQEKVQKFILVEFNELSEKVNSVSLIVENKFSEFLK